MNLPVRRDNVLTETVANEFVVYDQDRHCVHHLNPTAGVVWKHCDGQRSIAELTAVLHQEIGEAATQELVWLTLDRLEAAYLLAEPSQRTTEDRRLSRRQALHKISLTGSLAALLPVVFTLAAPTAAHAQSCGCDNNDGPCGSS